MEDYYFLNYDCLSCFHISEFKIYNQILLINKSFFSNINNLNHLQIFYNVCDSSVCVNINILQKLTSLKLISKKYLNLRIDYICCPLLQKLKISKCKSLANFECVMLLQNVCDLNISNLSLSIDVLNKFSKLTRLIFHMHENDNDKFYILNCLSSLVKLKIRTVNYMLQNIEHKSLINLKSLTINVIYNRNIRSILIKYPNLTHLKICIFGGLVGKHCSANLSSQINLISLKILYMKINCMNFYLMQAINLRILKLYGLRGCDYNLWLHNRYNCKLRYLKIQAFDYIKLDNMTNLKTKILYNVKTITEL